MAKARPPSHYFDLSPNGQKLLIKRTVDGGISFAFRNTHRGHLAAAERMKSLEKSEPVIHELLLFHCPQHVKDRLNGKATIQSESIRSETSGTGSDG